MPDVVASKGQSMSHPQNLRRHSEEVAISWVQTTAVTVLEQTEKTRDKESRWALHRRKSHKQRHSQASMFDTDHQIATFCVLTQHSTVEWHTVLWPHTALIFCGKELRPCRYWSHSSNAMVKVKDVPVCTMKTFRGSTVITALICNLSRK